ncbi:MAG TPA: hypothetical protein VMW72_07615 [Sedimentisphaerales bacterium]|nr:hypothetical protein [Sedimentisphaerales bacterium]
MPEEKKSRIPCQCGETFSYGEEDIYVKDDEQDSGIGHVRCPVCNAEHDIGVLDDDIEQTHTI